MTNDDKIVEYDDTVVAYENFNIKCLVCNYLTSNRFDFKKHLETKKHKTNINGDNKQKNDDKPYICDCGKIYKYRQGLSVHRKKCDYNNIITNNKEEDDDKELTFKEMFIEMMHQNKMLQNTICELIPKVGGNTNNINNNSNNTVNQNVSINVFLNDNCKDAMTLDDFIKTIEVDVDDLTYTKKKGLANGVTNLFVSHLNKLPMVQRPVWCSDKKRKKLYIKEDVWKEDTNNEKTKEAIYNVSKIQTKNLTKYVKENPDWMSSDQKKEDYMLIVKNATDSMQDKMDNVIDKMIDNIHLTPEKREKIKTN